MKFDELYNITINEDLEEDLFIDALDDSPKKDLVVNLFKQLLQMPSLWNRDRIKKSAKTLMVMSKKPFLKHYIDAELKKHYMDYEDLDLIIRGVVSDDERKEEKRKLRGLGR